MPRYYFDLIDHVTVEDRGGQILVDDGAAAHVADELARKLCEIQPELRDRGFSVVVKDANGVEVHRAPVEEIAIRPALSH